MTEGSGKRFEPGVRISSVKNRGSGLDVVEPLLIKASDESLYYDSWADGPAC